MIIATARKYQFICCYGRFTAYLAVLFVAISFYASAQGNENVKTDGDILTGAEQMEEYLPLIDKKRVAIVANPTSLINGVHLVDTLLASGVDIRKVFAPEHGFRGEADAGEHVQDTKDRKTGLPLLSLYGRSKKPSSKDLSDVDIVIFDIQDVGVRFYTYISSMHYVMEACAENNVEFLILDRPNPNGFFIDGPVLDKEFASFVGLHPVPLVHGMTIAEYAMMINGEGWLKEGVQCKVSYIKCKNYFHKDLYQLPVKPSPNLPNMASIYLYPSLGLFEGTIVSVGRGTDIPFQVIGHPELENTSYSFTPESKPGAKNPPYEGEKCNGFDLTKIGKERMIEYGGIYLNWLLGTYKNTPDKSKYFLKSGFFDLLAGTDQLRKQVENGISAEKIKESWKEGLENFREVRSKYLLYDDFEGSNK